MKIEEFTIWMNGRDVLFYSVEKEGYVAGGGVALFRKEEDANEYITLRAQLAERDAQIAEMRMLINLIDKTLLSDLINTKADVDLGYVKQMRDKVSAVRAKYPKVTK